MKDSVCLISTVKLLHPPHLEYCWFCLKCEVWWHHLREIWNSLCDCFCAIGNLCSFKPAGELLGENCSLILLLIIGSYWFPKKSDNYDGQIWLRLIHNRWGQILLSWGNGDTPCWDSVGNRFLLGASHQMLHVKDYWCNFLAQKTCDAHLSRSWKFKSFWLSIHIVPMGWQFHSRRGWVFSGLWLSLSLHGSFTSTAHWLPAPWTSSLIIVPLSPFDWGIFD